MKLNRNEHNRFIQWLDRTAEKNPLLWLPCILLIALAFMIVPDLSIVISFNAFADNTYIADNSICEIVGNEVTINGFDDNNQRYKASGEIVIPTSVIINNNSYVVTGISDNAFSNLTYITALVIPNTVSKIGNNILSEKFLNTEEEIDLYHIFCNSDSYAYTYLKEKQYPEHVIILMDSSDFLPINVFKSDYILGIFIDGKTTYETLITSERTYKTMLEEFDDNLAFKCGITSWQTLTFETSNLVDIFKDEHDFYLTYLCEILQSKYYKTQFDLAEMSDTINIAANALEIFEECGIDYNDRKTLTGEQLYELEKASVKLLKFDTSYVQPFKEFIKTGKSATEIINIICNMYYLSLISDETVEFLNIMKQNTNNASLKLAIDEVIASTINLPLLITEQVMLSQSETCVKKALGSIVDDIIGKNPACIALKFVRDGGQYIVNSVFSTDDIIKQYYTLKYFVELEDVIKKSCRQVENNFKQSRTEKNADVFLAGIDVYFQSIQYGYDCIDNMAKIVYQDSLMGWNADKYDSFHESAVKIKKEISDAYDQYGYIYRYISIYYRSEYSKHIPVESIAFAKESVEWGLNDKYFYGYSCSITPPNADNVEIVYTTSDSAVAEIENGIAKVHGVGNCVITATSVDNPKAFDTLNVTVIEGSGADSSLDEILPSYEDDYEYTISNDEVTITKYKGTDANVVIPKTIKGKPVRYISGAFENNENIISVQIQDSVGSIGWSTFENCTSLTSITIPDSVTSIEPCAFWGCTNLTSISIPNSITSIGMYAFENCISLTSITIPDSVISIHGYVFDGCTNLININVYINNKYYSSLDGVLFDKDLSNIIKYPSGIQGEYIIPSSVTYISPNAFDSCKSLTSITISDSVTFINNDAFRDCTSLDSIIIPNSVTYIDEYAFYGCTSLTNINIPNSVTSIKMCTFENCISLSKVNIADSITSIGWSAFRGCTSLTSINIPDSVTFIGNYAFKQCPNLTIYCVAGSYAESYANDQQIPFVYIDDTPTEKIFDIIKSADENTTLTVDTSKYGTDLTAEEVSAAKAKNLTLIINGNNFSWQTKATDLPNTTVDFKLISPSGNVDRSQFNESYKNRSFDFKTVKSSCAELTYNVGAENDGCCGNIFKVENGNFTLVSSDLVDNGQITFIPSDNSTYCIVISTNSNPISTDELFEKTSVVNAVLNLLSVNGTTINGFSPDKTDYTYSVSYADWSDDEDKIYNISAYANNSANVTISDNDFTLNSDNSDSATAKDVTITVTNDSGEEMIYTVKFVVEACPHTDRIENISKEPTCADLGEKETICELCGKQFGFESISALGHDFDNGTTTSEPDCVNIGTILFQCSRCSESFTRTIPALGHSWGEVTVDTTVTCTTDGSSSRHCERCGAHGSVTLSPATGHRFGAWTKVNDITYERICAVCGAAETKTVSITDHDHIFNGRVDTVTPATCQNVGSQNVYCSVDGCT